MNRVNTRKLLKFDGKRLLFAIFALVVSATSFAQIGTAKEFMWDNVKRDYIEYVPQSYNAEQPTAVVFMLHGLRDSMEYKLELSGLLPYADQYGWILVVPEALKASIALMGQEIEIGTMWNAGMNISVAGLTLSPNSTVDDCGFLTALLDSVKTNYNIHPDSVFFSGVSMGGFMCQRMAIEHADKISAVASVSGTIANGISSQTPIANVDIMHIHGTGDSVVTYSGADFSFAPFGSFNIGLSAEATVDYWVNFNQCAETPINYMYHNAKDDGMIFERYDYAGTATNSRVAFVKVVNGQHDWYANDEMYDINYADEIQKFFRGERPSGNVGIQTEPAVSCAVYPNPASSVLNIMSEHTIDRVEVYNICGTLVGETMPNAGTVAMSVAGYNSGVYIVRIHTQGGVATKKLMVK